MNNVMSRSLVASLCIALFALGVVGAIGVASVSYTPVAHAEAPAPAATETVDGANKPKVETPQQQEDSAYNGVMIKVMSLFAWLLGVAVITLDYAVYYTVVKMGSYINSLSAIGVAWRILRDLGNIALIFGFLAIGINIILGENYYGWGKNLLPKLLMAAVFLNFSLFISEAVIDTGNLFATQFYTQINGGKLPTADSLSGKTLQNIRNEGISNKIMSQLGMQSIYGDAIANKVVFEGSNPWFVGFMGILLFIVAAFVMFSLAFILIARFVALVFVIILSPIGLAGLAIPKLSGAASQWWDTLVGQTITAPVLLLMLYIALAVITDVQFLTGLGSGGNPSWNGTITGNIAGFASTFLSFLVAMGLLLAVTMYAKKLSAFGASWATKAAGTVVGGAVGYGLVGGTSLAGRTVLGGTGRVFNNKWMQAQASKGGVGGTIAKGFAFTGRKLENRTYDLRNVKTLGVAGGAITGALSSGQLAGSGFEAVGGGMGKGATVTAKQAVDTVQKAPQAVRDYFRTQQNEYEKAAAELKRKEILGNPSSTPDDIRKELSKMSTKELEGLNDIKKGVDSLVTNLSPQQFEALMKSDKLTDVEQGKVKEARYRPLSNAISNNSISDIKKAVNSFSKGELESMPATILTNPLVFNEFSDKQRDTITDSKERTAAEKDLIRKSSATGKIEEVFRGDPTLGPINAAKMIGSLSVAQVSKLPKDILKTAIIAAQFTPAMLAAIQEEKKLTSAEMTSIGDHIRTSSTASQKAKEYVTNGPAAALWS